MDGVAPGRPSIPMAGPAAGATPESAPLALVSTTGDWGKGPPPDHRPRHVERTSCGGESLRAGVPKCWFQELPEACCWSVPAPAARLLGETGSW